MSGFFMENSFFCVNGSFDKSDIVLFGAPFDGTATFRPGARFAPQTMRMESIGLETYSPYFNMDISDCSVFDAGDLDLPFGGTNAALDIIQSMQSECYSSGKKPLMLGGEHLITLPAVKEAYNKFSQLRVLHFDAHTDLRNEYLGQSLSHSSVLRRIWDFMGDGRIFQFGVRSGTREEFEWAESGHTSLCKFDFSTIGKAIEEIKDFPVYLTIDLDVLDPSIMSGTGTTEAGGVSFKELIETFRLIKDNRLNIVGADIVELSPHYDISGVSTAVACKILRELLFLL